MTVAKHILTLLFCCTFSLFEAAAQDIKTVQVADNLYFIGDRAFSCFYITEASVIVIDPLDATRAEATLAAIRKVTNKPISKVFYSHNHWDHISGGKVLQNADTKFISHIEAKNSITPNDAVVTPTETWQGTTTSYDFGNGQILELFYFGPNHGAGMTVFRFAEHNAVFIVDLVVPDRVLYAYLPDAKPKHWVESLEHIQKLKFDKVYMSHMRVEGTRKDVTFMQEYFKALYDAVDKELANKTPFFDIPTTVKLPQYAHLKNYNQWLPMNVWRILMEKSIGQ